MYTRLTDGLMIGSTTPCSDALFYIFQSLNLYTLDDIIRYAIEWPVTIL